MHDNTLKKSYLNNIKSIKLVSYIFNKLKANQQQAKKHKDTKCELSEMFATSQSVFEFTAAL